MGTWAKRILVFLLLLVVTGVGGVYYLIHRSDSTVDGTVLVEGIAQPVRIIRDIYGIPHIFAHNRKDLAFAFGFSLGDILEGFGLPRNLPRIFFSKLSPARASSLSVEASCFV